jgi:predicted lipoprotein with Yx(FWY)xxD motif
MLLAGVLVAAMSGAAIATASASAATVELRQTSRGPILVDGSGFTLYEFTLDKKHTENCVRIIGCYEVWHPLYLSGALTAGPGIRASKLSSIGFYLPPPQVTYYGHPLYTYIGDTMPEQMTGIGASQFGGFWYGINAKGRAVK